MRRPRTAGKDEATKYSFTSNIDVGIDITHLAAASFSLSALLSVSAYCHLPRMVADISPSSRYYSLYRCLMNSPVLLEVSSNESIE